MTQLRESSNLRPSNLRLKLVLENVRFILRYALTVVVTTLIWLWCQRKFGSGRETSWPEPPLPPLSAILVSRPMAGVVTIGVGTLLSLVGVTFLGYQIRFIWGNGKPARPWGWPFIRFQRIPLEILRPNRILGATLAAGGISCIVLGTYLIIAALQNMQAQAMTQL